MAGNHLREPLDYLYEELPPEKMAEVRQHLSKCPECREQMRSIRETVKLYRKADHPIPPEGLSATTIKNALKIARVQKRSRIDADAITAPKQPAASTASVAPIAAAAFLSMPPDRKDNPVAASAAVSVVAAKTPNRREEHNDAEFSRLKEEVLGELHNNGWRSWLFHPAWTVAASVIFLCSLLIHFSPRMYRQDVSSFVASPIRDDTALQLRDRERLPASRPRARLDIPPASEASPILHEAALINQPPPFFPSGESLREHPFRDAVEQPPASVAKVANANALPQTPETDAVQEHAKPFTASSSLKTFPVIGSGAEHLEELKQLGEPAQAKPDEQSRQAEPRKKPDVAIMMLDGFSPDVVPQIVERPTPIDVTERVRSLSALIGMQIASGEINDALQALGILERYDPRVAAEMRKLLLEVPVQSEQEKPKARIGSPLPADAPTPHDEPVPTLEPVSPPDKSDVLPNASDMPTGGNNSQASCDASARHPLDAPVAASAAIQSETPAFVPSPAMSLESPLGVIEPPEDPPLSTVRVPAFDFQDSTPEQSKPDVPVPSREDVDATTAAKALSLTYDIEEVETIVPAPLDADEPVNPVSGSDAVEIIDVEKYFSLDAAERVGNSAAREEGMESRKQTVPDSLYHLPEDASTMPEAEIIGSTAVPLRQVTVPKVMEPAASLDGFTQMRTGPDRTTWIAVDSGRVEEAIPIVESDPPTLQSLATAPLQPHPPQPLFFLPSLPAQPLPVTTPTPLYQSSGKVRRAQTPKPYFRDF